MAKIIWSENAIEDLIGIANYGSKYSDKYASSIVSRLFNKVMVLKSLPKLGRIVPEKNDPKIRELIEGNYRIIYELQNDDTVEILLVHHSSRPLQSI